MSTMSFILAYSVVIIAIAAYYLYRYGQAATIQNLPYSTEVRLTQSQEYYYQDFSLSFLGAVENPVDPELIFYNFEITSINGANEIINLLPQDPEMLPPVVFIDGRNYTFELLKTNALTRSGVIKITPV